MTTRAATTADLPAIANIYAHYVINSVASFELEPPAADEWQARFAKVTAAGLPFLATVGSTAPFIGLFGTVWGIKTAFEEIAISQNTSLAVVAPGIAEALVATALGLLAAIPAVIFYNKLSADSDRLISNQEAFADEFSTILSRQLDDE